MWPSRNFSGWCAISHVSPSPYPTCCRQYTCDRRAVVVPDEGRRRKADLPSARLQPPAHVHVVAGAQVDRVEAADGQQRVAPEGHVAPGHVFRDAIVEQHVRGAARCTRHALCNRRVVCGHDVRPARSDDIRREERLDEKREPVRVHARVRVRVGDDLAGRLGQPDVARGAQARVRDLDDLDARVPAPDVAGGIAGTVVDQDDFVVRIRQPIERGQAVFERVRGVVGADDDGHAGPRGPGRCGKRRVFEGLGHRDGRGFHAPLAIDEAERPVVHVVAAAPPLVGPREGHRAAGAFFERRAHVHGGNRGLALFAFSNRIGARFGQQQRFVAGDVLQPRQIRAQLGLAVQVHVERAHVEEREIQEFSRRKVDVREQGSGRDRFRVVIQVAQKTFDAQAAVPTDHARRDFVAEREHERRGMIRELADLVADFAPDRPRQPPVVQERHVLRPRQTDHHPQSVARGLVQ